MGISVVSCLSCSKEMPWFCYSKIFKHSYMKSYVSWVRETFPRPIRDSKGSSEHCWSSRDLWSSYSLHTNISPHAHPTLLSPVNQAAWMRILGFRFYLVHPGNWNVSIKFCSRDAATWVARNPGFPPVDLTFSHHKLLAAQNNRNLLFNASTK